MALKVELKPHERIIIGACVVTNTDQRARLLIDGDKIPILREKDILTPETADTPAKRPRQGAQGSQDADRLREDTPGHERQQRRLCRCQGAALGLKRERDRLSFQLRELRFRARRIPAPRTTTHRCRASRCDG